METIVRKKVTSIDRPFKFQFFLFFHYCFEVIIDGAINEFKFPSIWRSLCNCSDVIKKIKVYICELPSKIHSSCYHDMVRFIMNRIGLKTPEKRFRLCSNNFCHVLKMGLHLRFNLVVCPLIHSTWSVIQLVHNMSEDTMLA